MADTMLPNTLMMLSRPYCLWLRSTRGRARCAAAAIRKCLRSPTHSEARWGDDAISALYFVAMAVRSSCRAATSQPTQFEM
jgi:hypothetical protein